MANRYELSDELKDKYRPIVKEYIDKLEKIPRDEADEVEELNLSDTGLNPMTLSKIMESLGYKETNTDDNGWQWDFWWEFRNEDKIGAAEYILVKGTGATFELMLASYGD